MIEVLHTNALLEKFSLKDLMKNKDIIIVDVREPGEYVHEHIKSSLNVPLSKIAELDPRQFQDKIAVFHCRSGGRTKMSEHVLANTPFKEKYCLAGGILEWKVANLPVVKQTKAPIDVMRQMQLIVSLFIFIGLALGVWVSAYFLLIPAFIACGLLVSGLTGFCGLVFLLKMLPWNRVKQ